MNENKTNIEVNSDIKFKNFLSEVRKELDIIAIRQKIMEDERNRLFEVAKKPSTVTRLKTMKKSRWIKWIMKIKLI